MKNADARFIVQEIDEARKRRKRFRLLDYLTGISYNQVKFVVESGYDLNQQESDFLKSLYERITDPIRLKWGKVVRPR